MTNDIVTKKCQKCCETKLASAFSKMKSSKDGLKPKCKACEAAHYVANREKILETTSASRAKNPDKFRQRNAAWRSANQDKVREYSDAWYKANRDSVRETTAAYRAANSEKRRQYNAAWRAANQDRERETKAAYRAANPEAMRIYSHTRRFRKLKNGGKLSRGITAKLMKFQKGRCACCKSDLSETGHHLDHIMPLALGGANDDDNVQLLCPTCNRSKCAKHPVDFMQSRGFLL